MKIPSRFKLGGHEIKVVLDRRACNRENASGLWMEEEKKVVLKNVGHSYWEQVFWHEAVHAILIHMGYEKLSKDEKLVDRIAQGIHQIVVSSSGELTKTEKKTVPSLRSGPQAKRADS